jgi:hypothetical protein
MDNLLLCSKSQFNPHRQYETNHETKCEAKYETKCEAKCATYIVSCEYCAMTQHDMH